MLTERKSRGRPAARGGRVPRPLLAVGFALGAAVTAVLVGRAPVAEAATQANVPVGAQASASARPSAVAASGAPASTGNSAQASGASESVRGSAAPTDTIHFDPNNKWTFFEQYCEKCHNSTDWAGGVAFDAMSPDSIPQDAKELEEAVRKLQGRLMPPPGKPQPDQQTVDLMVNWLTDRLDEAGGGHPNPGSVVIHRLNRTEYAREVHDLLALNIDAAALLPKDTKSEGGFDNMASVLKVSPSFLDQYLVAAHDVSVAAIGSNTASAAPAVYR